MKIINAKEYEVEITESTRTVCEVRYEKDFV